MPLVDIFWLCLNMYVLGVTLTSEAIYYCLHEFNIYKKRNLLLGALLERK